MVTGRVKFGENLTEIPELMLITPSNPRPLDSIFNCDKRVVQMCFLLGLNVCVFLSFLFVSLCNVSKKYIKDSVRSLPSRNLLVHNHNTNIRTMCEFFSKLTKKTTSITSFWLSLLLTVNRIYILFWCFHC